MMKRGVWSFVLLWLGLLVVGLTVGPVPALAQPVPQYEVDTSWPQLPLGDQWITGGLGGMCLDARDHVYLLNRQNIVTADLDGANLAPPVIELDPEGRVVRGWGEMAQLGDRLHDCHVDADQNIWSSAAGTGHIQKYSSDGTTLLLQAGETGVYDSSDGTRQGRPLNSNQAQCFLPASIDVDVSTGEIFVADGETPRGNQRIAVLDRDGNFLRQWVLHRTTDEANLIPLPHCIRVANDGLVYVCDRQADRIQVFDRHGTFIRNIDVPWEPLTPRTDDREGTRGSAVVLDFSPDAEQRLLFTINQNNGIIEVIERKTGTVLSSFGGGHGRYAGQFTLPHGIAVDSAGNVYIAEQEGRRIQRFTPVLATP